MENNPYQVLGVSPGASPEEIKAAYRALVKKYHPDRYSGSPLEAQAQEKLKQINLAYDELTKNPEPAMGRGGSAGTRGGYRGGAAGWETGWDAGSRYAAVMTLMRANRLYEAYVLLQSVPEGQRDAQWYYLSGCVAQRRGWNGEAQEFFQQAVVMEPGNVLYRQAMESMRQENGFYERTRARRQRRYQREAETYANPYCCCFEPCCEVLGCMAIPCCCTF